MPSTDGMQCQLRIGINSSEVIAGVVGSTKFHYDAWGDAVNIAARMESQGEPGRIQLAPAPTPSSTTTSPACCVRAGIKCKGVMQTGWLVGGGIGGIVCSLNIAIFDLGVLTP